MYLKKSNFVLYLGIALVAGFGFSLLLSSTAQSNLLSGDISKAGNFSNHRMADPYGNVIAEKLMNDKSFFNTTQSTVALLSERVGILKELTDRTQKVCGDIPEFQPLLKSMQSLHAKAHNTGLAVAAAEKDLQSISDGRESAFEQSSANAYIGFKKIESQLDAGKAFVEFATEYLEGRKCENSDEIIDLVSDWTKYCVIDAVINGSDEEVVYWKDKSQEITGNESLAALASDQVIMAIAFDGLVSSGATEQLVSSGATEQMVACGSVEKLVSSGATEQMVASVSVEKMVSAIASNEVFNSTALEQFVNAVSTERVFNASPFEAALENFNPLNAIDKSTPFDNDKVVVF